MEKLSIGLTYTGTTEKQQYYSNWLQQTGRAEVITLSTEANNASVLYRLHGLVMTGGIDVHPLNYGSLITDYPHAPAAFNTERDAFETALFNEALKMKLPVLAICRGMQLANCILGGDLVQDLGEDKNRQHRNTEIHQVHEVVIKSGTLLQHITGKEKDITDSAHHQCINKTGRGLMINALAEDGIIEGIEWENKQNKNFFLGVQWHPERMFLSGIDDSTLSKNIRESFLDAVAAFRSGT